ncbi:MAG TPA: hypothetical protein VER17_16190, partial [Tepidisphaeraceae bacterium]|nr:hypothetical protein [Tepidisphaeraceae bacterium]
NVVVVRKADLAAIDEQIRAENAKLPEIERRHAAAKERSDELERASDTVTDRFGNTRRVQRNSERVIGEARVAVDRVVDEKRKLKQRVARLEREKVTAASTRTIVGKLDDGTAVQVDVDAPAMIALADELATGVKYNVAGVGRIVEGVLRVKPRTIVPAE